MENKKNCEDYGIGHIGNYTHHRPPWENKTRQDLMKIML